MKEPSSLITNKHFNKINRHGILLTFILLLVLQTIVGRTLAKDLYPVDAKVDIQHYRFELNLNLEHDSIFGTATITARLSQPGQSIILDLTEVSEGKGMKVMGAYGSDQALSFKHDQNKLEIDFSTYQSTDTLLTFSINYKGIPTDGLIIAENKHGKKTFFGDNWPDRARHWLPCIDHVSDKATVEFLVTAPQFLEVIAVGYRAAVYPAGGDHQTTHYISSVELPTKVMVIGVADFAMKTAGFADQIPIETWVYAEENQAGFIDYAPAVEIVRYFNRKIGRYAYEKLANVQSKTVYGGMENAGAIFYYERSVSGQNRLHSLLAHEIAHQWFGDAVTEGDWHHIWLSEGFATYLEAVYMAEEMRRRSLAESMARSRSRVTAYYQRNPKPLVDTTITNLRRLLSTNSYQKGAWVLHMLRNKLGDELFWKGIQKYYADFKNGNALTDDFRKVMEQTAGQNLDIFFEQWVFTAGHPVLSYSDQYLPDEKTMEFKVIQHQDRPFNFDLVVGFELADGSVSTRVVEINRADHTFKIPLDKQPVKIILDPDCQLLYEFND